MAAKRLAREGVNRIRVSLFCLAKWLEAGQTF